MLFYLHTLQTRNEDDKMKWMATLVSLIETDLSLLSNDTLVSISCAIFIYIHIYSYTPYLCTYVCTYVYSTFINAYVYM